MLYQKELCGKINALAKSDKMKAMQMNTKRWRAKLK